MRTRRVAAAVSLPLAYVAGNALGHLIAWVVRRVDSALIDFGGDE